MRGEGTKSDVSQHDAVMQLSTSSSQHARPRRNFIGEKNHGVLVFHDRATIHLPTLQKINK